jgi:2-polyprenyl-3-methyl-5-hydroxy-6-metoxy-1,4-benzoquinol methylase
MMNVKYGNMKAIDIFNKYASEYQSKFMDVSPYHHSLDIFVKSLPSGNSKLFEIACGPGNITKYLLQKNNQLQILATDLAPKMIELAKANNPSAEVILLDARNILSIQKIFDGIMCGFCLPYLSIEETTTLISDCSHLLKQNGVIYLSTMEDKYHNSGFRTGSKGDEIFMHYYEAETLENLLVNNGFKVLEIERVKTQQTDDSFAIDLIIIAQKIN